MTPRIRPARLEDEEALKRIDLANWEAQGGPEPKPETPGDYRFFDWGPKEEFLVAEAGGEVAGYVKLGGTEIEGLAVDPARQRRGIGEALMRAVLDEARRLGHERVTLRVDADNAAARTLYERLGFRVEPDDGADVLMAYGWSSGG